jgi:DNA-binding NarL/FixJ family response regulator
MAAQAITNAAAQLGLSEVISTAVNGAEALARVAASPADVLLVDTASVRPDTVAFTRRVLEHAPEAVVVFFGPEDAVIARGAVAAGARGLIRGGEREDLVASVAKALMLLLRSGRAMDGAAPPQAVPLQRSEPEDANGEEAAEEPSDKVAGARTKTATAPAPPATAAGVGVGAVRRVALTERELQVLRGMADGKSNAEIGRELFVSEDTVKTHARRLFRKLGARDRAHAVAAAFRAGLVR